MKILVIAHGLRAAGGRVVALNLLRAFLDVDQRHTYYLLVPDQPEYRALGLECDRTEVHYYRRRLGHLGRVLFDGLKLKGIVRDYQPDVILGLGNLGLLRPPVPQAIWTMHPYLFYDLRKVGDIPIVFRTQIHFLRRHFRRQLPATAIVFCQTATMEKRLRSVYGYTGKTMVVENAISKFPPIADEGEAIPAKLAPYEGKFKLFYLTRYYPHKGIEILVEVMDQYRDVLKDVVIVLTIDASQGNGAAKLLQQIEEKGLTDQIVNVGPLDKEELPAHYAACDGLIMPTRLESFSSAHLEAMHFGLPIITSDLDFAREVCGDAALYFDPWDPASIRDRILDLAGSKARAEELIARGRERLKTFSATWDAHAARMLSELEQLAEDR